MGEERARRRVQEYRAFTEELTDAALAVAEAVAVGEHPRGLTSRASDARWASAEVLAAEGRIFPWRRGAARAVMGGSRPRYSPPA